jgi:hypothetical protein
MLNRSLRKARLAAVAGVFAAAGAVAGCDKFLETTNPSAIQPETLDDSTFIGLMVNGAVGEFQAAFPVASYYSSVFTDELRNTHVFSEEISFDRRDVDSLNGTHSVFVYTPMQRAWWMADSVGGRIRALGAAGDSASRDLRLARVLGYAGYSLIWLAENLCGTPVSTAQKVYSKALSSDSVFTLAILRLDSAITIANAAKTAAQNAPATTVAAITALRNATIAGADSIRLWATVGKARAALNRGDMTAAATYASQVTAFPGQTNFEYRISFNTNSALTRLNNPLRLRLSGGAGITSGALTGTPFENIDDIRVPYPRTATNAGQAEATMSGSWVVPNSPRAFNTYTGTAAGADFDYGGTWRIASLIEAQYIQAEANGATPASIAFVESQRLAFPSTTAAAPTTAANFLDNLIDQRRRELYLDGHRMGDLRRYEKLYNRNLWQTGVVPGQTLSFSNRHCLPLNLAEYQNNPELRNP